MAFRASSAGARGATAPRQPSRGAPRGRRHRRNGPSRVVSQAPRAPRAPRPGWDEDTRAPSFFDTQLQQIFTKSRPQPAPPTPDVPRGVRGREERPFRPEKKEPAQADESAVRSRNRPGHLRERLQDTMVSRQRPKAPTPAPPKAVEVERPIEADAPAPRPLWEAQPPLIPWRPQPPPEQLAVAHVQRRVSHLGEKLALLLPQAKAQTASHGEDAFAQVRPFSSVRRTLEHAPGHSDRMSPETPEKVQKLSRRLRALLGEGPAEAPAEGSLLKPTPFRPGKLPCPDDFLRQNAARVVGQADLLVDLVLEEVFSDAAEHLEALPSKEMHPEHANGEAEQVQTEAVEDVPHVPDATLTRMVQSATDKLLVLEHELRMTYGEAPASPLAKFIKQPASGRRHPSQEEELRRSCDTDDEDWRVASVPAKKILELERYRALFAHHCMAAREAGIQSPSRTATWVIWPFLADGITMALVQSAIEELDDAMENYVGNLIVDEVGYPGDESTA